jgi:hypothetical protein
MSRYLKDQEAVDAAVQAHTKRSYFVGLDLGQVSDPTAIAVLERHRIPQLDLGRVPAEIPYRDKWVVRYAERLSLRTEYPAVIEHMRRLLHTSPLSGNSRLIVDYTGVGRPVYDLLRRARLSPVGVTITAGDKWSMDGASYRVAKSLLASHLDATLNEDDFHVAPTLKEAEVLKAELGDFWRRTTASGHTQFEAREGRHDDLVLASTIALWYARTIGNQSLGMGRVVW